MSAFNTVADEYYVATRHPTCSNFRVASKIIISAWLLGIRMDAVVCELGAGKSIAAEELLVRNQWLDRVIITDQSERMIRHSLPFKDNGAVLIVANAEELPFKGHQFDCLVSSLGDPYNTINFWSEASRVLKPDGSILFTVPAHSWAECFRKNIGGASYPRADFELSDGRHVLLPSYIFPEARQRAMIEKNGMRVTEIRRIRIGDIRDDELSPKLCIDRGLDGEIVTGYLARNERV